LKPKGLAKEERLSAKNDFQFVYSKGKTIYSYNNSFKAVVCFTDNADYPPVKVAFAVHKKAGNAVWRNRVKRLLRESYRLNKMYLINRLNEVGKKLLIVLSPNSVNQRNKRVVKLDDVIDEIISLLNIIKAEL